MKIFLKCMKIYLNRIFFFAGMCSNFLKRVRPTLAYVGHFKGICGETCHKKKIRTETAHLRYRETILRAVTAVREKLQLT